MRLTTAFARLATKQVCKCIIETLSCRITVYCGKVKQTLNRKMRRQNGVTFCNENTVGKESKRLALWGKAESEKSDVILPSLFVA
ncbi:MAG: hypothetical protein ACI4QU_03145, partial [Christensenellales bacterium]